MGRETATARGCGGFREVIRDQHSVERRGSHVGNVREASARSAADDAGGAHEQRTIAEGPLRQALRAIDSPQAHNRRCQPALQNPVEHLQRGRREPQAQLGATFLPGVGVASSRQRSASIQSSAREGCRAANEIVEHHGLIAALPAMEQQECLIEGSI